MMARVMDKGRKKRKGCFFGPFGRMWSVQCLCLRLLVHNSHRPLPQIVPLPLEDEMNYQ